MEGTSFSIPMAVGTEALPFSASLVPRSVLFIVLCVVVCTDVKAFGSFGDDMSEISKFENLAYFLSGENTGRNRGWIEFKADANVDPSVSFNDDIQLASPVSGTAASTKWHEKNICRMLLFHFLHGPRFAPTGFESFLNFVQTQPGLSCCLTA